MQILLHFESTADALLKPSHLQPLVHLSSLRVLNVFLGKCLSPALCTVSRSHVTQTVAHLLIVAVLILFAQRRPAMPSPSPRRAVAHLVFVLTPSAAVSQ